MTSALKNVNESLANVYGGNYLQKDFVEVLHPAPEETRTAEEVIQHIKDGLNEIGA